MARTNEKQQLISYENSIKKSNEFSMAKLNHGLTLNQMQLLAYAIYCTQQDGSTEFIKADFERKFGIKRYKTDDAFIDSEKVSALRYSTQNLAERKFSFTAIFTDLRYDNGNFKIIWNPIFIPHILELKDYYVTTDLTITSQFKSSFSWTLYEYLKASYGAYYSSISKDALLRLFGVEDRKTYIDSTSQFKRGVLDVAISEINKYTELEVWYLEKKKGRAIIGFELHWSTGKTIPVATATQIEELKRLLDEVFSLWDQALQIRDEAYKEDIKKLILETELMKKDNEEQLTSKEASEYIPRVKVILKLIISMLNNDTEPVIKDVPFYNWLEERE